jgi:hypothetical protein
MVLARYAGRVATGARCGGESEATMDASTNLDEIRAANNGKLPAYAWPGGYPIIYLTASNDVLCPDCANKPVDEYSDPPVSYGPFWEGEPLTCDDCGKEIESAYGDPEAENI